MLIFSYCINATIIDIVLLNELLLKRLFNAY